MRRRILGLLLAAAACLPLTAQAAYIFTTTLAGPNEEPPNASPGTGSVTVTWDDTAHTMRVEASFEDLLGLTSAAHIHVINGPGDDANTADTVGPVATMTPSFLGFPLGVTAGAFDQTFDMTLASSYNASFITNSGSLALAESQLLAALLDGRAYFNIHTQSYPGGEIRGFLATVPEPGSFALLVLGLVGLVWLRAPSASSRAPVRAWSANTPRPPAARRARTTPAGP